MAVISKTTQRKTAARSPITLLKIIDERRRLAKAQAILGCLSKALEYGDPAKDGSDLADVATAARELVNRAIDELDPVNFFTPR